MIDTHVLYRRRLGVALFTAILAPISAVGLIALDLGRAGHDAFSVAGCIVPAVLLLLAAGSAWALARDHEFDVCPVCHPGRREPADRHPVWQDWFLVFAGSLLDDAPWMTFMVGLVLATAGVLCGFIRTMRWYAGWPLLTISLAFFFAAFLLYKRKAAREKAEREEIERIATEYGRPGPESAGSTDTRPKVGGR